jgi:hypothetical protein
MYVPQKNPPSFLLHSVTFTSSTNNFTNHCATVLCALCNFCRIGARFRQKNDLQGVQLLSKSHLIAGILFLYSIFRCQNNIKYGRRKSRNSSISCDVNNKFTIEKISRKKIMLFIDHRLWKILMIIQM